MINRFQIFVCFVLLINYSFSQEKNSSALDFVPNQGQITDFNSKPRTDVLFSSEVSGVNIFLRKNGISYLQSDEEEVDKKIRKKVKEFENNNGQGVIEFENKLRQESIFSFHQIDVDFYGSNSIISVQKKKKTEDYLNFYNSKSPKGITNVSLYNLVQYKNVYNGIDIDFYGNNKGFEYDFIISPNSDPNQINLLWQGSDGIELNKEGKLLIKTTIHDIVESIPEAYQFINGKKTQIDVKYKINNIKSSSNKLISFIIGNYNPQYELIIDPWVTYYGGANFDRGNDLYNDNLGNLYVGGYTSSSTAIATAGSFKALPTVLTGFGYDGFLTKFSPNGNRLWATYYGGSGNDFLQAVTVDKNNDVYITGYTSSDTGIATVGSFKDTLNYNSAPTPSGIDAFLVKFSPTGIRIWGTYYGGSNFEFGTDVTTDTSNNIYITGRTSSVDLISTPGAYKTSLTISGTSGYDSFIAKFSSTGNRVWGTYHGGENYDYSESITSDSHNNIFICGNSSSTVDIGTLGTHQPNITIAPAAFYGNDAFLIKFTSAGVRVWGTYFGGDGIETCKSVVVDTNDHIYVAGRTNSTSLISTPGSFQSTLNGIGDAYLAKFTQSGLVLWSTYYGGSGYDYAYSVSVNKITNNVLISGDTYSSDLPVSPCALQTGLIGLENGFIGNFYDNGSIYCSSYFGNQHEEDNKLTTFGCYIYLTGYSPGGVVTTAGAHQTSSGGSTDGYIAQLYTNTCGISTPIKSINLTKTDNSKVCKPCNGEATVSLSSTCLTDSLYTYTWSDGTVISNITDTFNTLNNLCAGNYWVEISIANSCYTTRDTMFFTIIDTNTVVINFSHDSVCFGFATNFTNTTINEPTGTGYGWSFGDGNSSILNNPDHTYGSSGSFLVTYIQQYGPGCFDTISKNVIVHEKPQAELSVTMDGVEYFSNNLDSICSYLFEPIDFNDYSTISSGVIDQFNWRFGTEGSISNQNVSYSFQGIQNHLVTLEVISEFGCKDTTFTIIKICDDFNFNIPNSFTPNGDGLNDVFTHVGFGIDTERYEFSIYNRWGELLFKTTTFEPWDGKYLGEDVKDDVYIWKVRYKNLNGLDVYEKSGHVTLTRPDIN